MGPPSYMRFVVDRNVVMRRVPVVCGDAVANPSSHSHLRCSLHPFQKLPHCRTKAWHNASLYVQCGRVCYCHLRGKWQHRNMTDEDCGSRRFHVMERISKPPADKFL